MRCMLKCLLLLAGSLLMLPASAGTVTGDLRIENVNKGTGTRTLRIWLPANYAAHPTRKYPVVYMFDGQNLFDAQTAAFGSEWQVDETMTSFVTDGVSNGAIIVGIDNEGTGKGRYEEFTNWDWTHPSIGFINARGDETAAWLVNTVIPYVNGKYRTLTGRSYTALAGSSMGGYMTIYTGMAYPRIFGKLASFSTVALDSPMQGQNLRAFVEAAKSDPERQRWIASTRIYLDMGDAEQLSYTTSALLVDNHERMCASLIKAGFSPTCRVIAGGAHNESAWSARVDDAFRILSLKDSSFTRGYRQVYVRGTHNAWARGSSMTLVGNDTWETTVIFGSSATERFKFDIHGDWQLTFGDNNADGIADAGGSDIMVSQGAGTYTIRFHDQMRSYSVVKAGGNMAPLAKAGPDQIITSGVPVTVTLNGAASSDADGVLASWTWAEWLNGSWLPVGSGPSLMLNSVGTGEHRYRLTVTDNLGASASDEVLVTIAAGGFSKTWPQVYVRGTHNGWGTTTAMTLVGNNSWELVASFAGTASERFKFDIHGDWLSNFGDTNRDGIADAGGSDIAVSQGVGSYRIRINDLTRAYTVVKQ